MLGTELEQLFQSLSESFIEFKPKKIVIDLEENMELTIKTAMGDELKITELSHNLLGYIFAWWIGTIKKYQMGPEGMIFPTNIYWNLYKSGQEAKKYFSNQSLCTTFLNGEKITFAPTAHYFDTANAAVYGIYKDGELVYIDSNQNYKDGWKKHYTDLKYRENFTMYNNELYHLQWEPESIEFKILCDEQELKRIADVDSLNTYIIEMVEERYIQYYKPKYNTNTFKYFGSTKMLTQEQINKISNNIDKNLTFN